MTILFFLVFCAVTTLFWSTVLFDQLYYLYRATVDGT